MSGKSKNHSRGTMPAFRQMAAEGYPSDKAVWGSRPMPQLLRRNARWRPIVRLLAKHHGWTFADGFLYTMYGPSTTLLFGSMFNAEG